MKLHDFFDVLNRTSLVVQIFIGLVAGILVALLWPSVAGNIEILGQIFITALKSVAPVLVFILVTAAISNYDSNQPNHIKPIINNFWGAGFFFPKQYIANTLDDVRRIYATPADPEALRAFIEKRYSPRRLAAQARQALAEKTKPLKKELEKIDTRMAQLGAEKAALEEKLATPLPPADIAEAGKRLKAVGDELDASEERWLELSEAIEQLTQAAEA